MNFPRGLLSFCRIKEQIMWVLKEQEDLCKGSRCPVHAAGGLSLLTSNIIATILAVVSLVNILPLLSLPACHQQPALFHGAGSFKKPTPVGFRSQQCRAAIPAAPSLDVASQTPASTPNGSPQPCHDRHPATACSPPHQSHRINLSPKVFRSQMGGFCFFFCLHNQGYLLKNVQGKWGCLAYGYK